MPQNEALEIKRREARASTPECASAERCTEVWEAAQLWVARNAGYKIQTVTSVLIETYNPGQYSTSLAARVLKEPRGGGRYAIVASFWCANIFGCTPMPLDALLEFNRALGGGMPQKFKE